MTGINCQNTVIRGDDKCEHSLKEIPTRDSSLLSACNWLRFDNRTIESAGFPYFDNLNVTFVVLNQSLCCSLS
jgi:hypothetical protein